MYLHLGKDVIVNKKDIIGIFDIDKTTVSKRTRKFLRQKEEQGKAITITNELPRSFILCMEKGEAVVYISQISPTTLYGRSEISGPTIF